MAKKKTMVTEKQVRAAEAKLVAAAAKFYEALGSFKKVYDPETVGLDEWIEDCQNTMAEISEDISATFREE